MINTVVLSGYDMPKLVEYIDKKNFLSDVPRDIGWGLLESLCKFLDAVFKAFNELLGYNFYNIPAVKAFVTKTVPLAWACFGLAIIIGAICLMIFKDKLKISDFFKNILVSAALIVALPFTLSVLTDMKNAGVSDMQAELTQNETIGKTILGSITVDVEASANSNSIKTLLDSKKNAYSIEISDELSKNAGWNYYLTSKPFDVLTQKENQDSSGDIYLEAISGFFGISTEDYKTYQTITDTNKKANYFQTIIKPKLCQTFGSTNDYTAITAINSATTFEEILNLYNDQFNSYVDVYYSEKPKPPLFNNTDDVKYFGGTTMDAATGTTYYKKKLDDGIIFDEELMGTQIQIHSELLEEHIYAYKPDIFMGILLSLATIVSLFFAGFKIVSLLFDLAFNQVIAPVIFATDLQGSGRTKKMIENIVSTYLVFIIILVLVKLYLDINMWAMTALTDMEDIVIKIIILIGTAKCVIDGPDIIVKLLGVDAGVKSGAAAMLGIQSAGRMAKSVLHGGNNLLHAPQSIGKAAHSAAIHANPITNAKNYMHQSKLDRVNLNDRWNDYKSNN